MTIGPVQMMVIGFAEPNFTGKIAAELDRLRKLEFLKIVDALVVQKDDDGNITALQVSDLSQDEAKEMGAIAGALVGFGYGDDETAEAGAEMGAAAGEDGHLIPEEEAWFVADAIRTDPSRPSSCSSTCGRSRFATRSLARAASRSPTSGSTRAT